MESLYYRSETEVEKNQFGIQKRKKDKESESKPDILLKSKN